MPYVFITHTCKSHNDVYIGVNEFRIGKMTDKEAKKYIEEHKKMFHKAECEIKIGDKNS